MTTTPRPEPHVVLAHPVLHPQPVTVRARDVAATVRAWHPVPTPQRVAAAADTLQHVLATSPVAATWYQPAAALGVIAATCRAPLPAWDPSDPTGRTEADARTWAAGRVAAALGRPPRPAGERERPEPAPGCPSRPVLLAAGAITAAAAAVLAAAAVAKLRRASTPATVAR